MARNLAPSRAKACALILEGRVFSNHKQIVKVGTMLPKDASLEVKESNDASCEEWVSRGAHKLLKALDIFHTNPTGKICMDIGASTGGFTHVMLSRGALKVYSVDVGYGQFAWKLRTDSRVVVMERTNARYLEPGQFEEGMDLITIDASFISLTLLLPVMEKLLKEDGCIICLVKPQFEAGKERLGKNGVVKDPLLHQTILQELSSFIEKQTLLSLRGATWSPLKGPKGNIEFLFFLQKGKKDESLHTDFTQIVAESHKTLDEK